MIGGVSDAGDAEEGLGDQCAGEQAGQRAADDGDQGDQGVAEGVGVDDLMFAETLGPCGADVVGVQHFQHVGTGVTHQTADAQHRQGGDRHDQVGRLIPELPHGGQILIAASHKAVQVKPAQLHGEQQLQQRSEEEGGQGDTGQSDDGDGIVGLAVLLGGGDNAKGDGDQQLQHEGDGAHNKGYPDRIMEFLHNGNGPFPAVAKLAPEQTPKPGKITRDDAFIHIIHFRQLIHPFLKALGAGLHGFLPGHRLDI